MEVLINKCKHDGCNNSAFCKGFCKKHYKQFYRYGKTFDTKYDANKYIINDNNAIILISYKESNLEVLIDLEDVEKCKKYKWYIQKSNVGDYIRVCAYNNGKTIKLHRLLLNITIPHIEIDHIDGNTLNNHKNNLRLCLHDKNSKNLKLYNNNTSGIKGVTYDNKTNKWKAEIQSDGIKYRLGTFDSIEGAIIAREIKEIELFGEFMRTKENL